MASSYTPTAKLLIIDDEAASMRALRDTLRDQGYETHGYTSGKDALQALQESAFDILLTDLMMPEMDGVALLSAALAIDPQLVGVLMTGRGTIETAVNAMKAGALDYVLKPIKLSAIQPVLARAVGVRRLRLENLELRNTVSIHELNQAMAYTLDPNVLLEKIIDAAVAQFQADEASIMLLRDEEFYIAAVRGKDREHLLGTSVPLNAGVARWIASNREPLALSGTVTDPRWKPLHPRPEIQSSLSLPMITRHKLIGIINVACLNNRRVFTPGQVKALSIFSSAAASGIEAARLHDAQRKADARYREVLQMAADAIVSVNEDQKIAVFNAGAERIFGYKQDEIIGKPLDLLIPKDIAEDHRAFIRELGQGPDVSRPMAGRNRLQGRRKDDSLFFADISISKRTEGGNCTYTAIVSDVTIRVEQENRIDRLSRLYAVLSGINSTIVRVRNEQELYLEISRIAVDIGKFKVAYVGMLDADGRVLTVAASAGLDLVNRSILLDELPDQSPISRAMKDQSVHWDNNLLDRPNLSRVRREAVAFGARAVAALPFTLDGRIRSMMLINADVPNAFGEDELKLLREAAGDVSFALDYIAKSHKVHYLATFDSLTDLPNRSLFQDRLAQAMAQARHEQTQLGIALIDIERFRHINDTFGRQAGDLLLRQFAERLRETTGEHASPARAGSDVFGLICPGSQRASELVREIRESTERIMLDPFEIEGHSLHLSARVGMAFFPADGKDPETLLQNAEMALKRAKTLHERIVCYTPDLNATVAAQLVLESKLRRALERNEFLLHYQPKIDIAKGTIVGLEALLRWQNPESGLVSPDQFIPLLEETGLILDVGRWAIQECVRMQTRLKNKGLHHIRIAVNVSPIQLQQVDFVQSVREALGICPGDSHGLDVEITESVVMHDIEANVQKLEQLRDMGLKIAIDDFGTGYSSLAYMAKLPAQSIKIDKTFVQNLHKTNNDSLSIVTSIISLAHALERHVIAEGVETQEQAEILRELGCDQLQGYHFSKPLPEPVIERLLVANAQ